MQFLPALTVFAIAAASPGPTLSRSEPVLVRTVIDGDTIDVAGLGRVRLLGIDAPELGRGFDTAAPFAREAREKLASLVLHHWVRLEQDVESLDVYNRHLAYVWREDGVFVNEVLLREGLARITARLPLARLDELRRAEQEARSFRRGMWGDSRASLSSSPDAGAPVVARKPRGRYTSKPKKSKTPPNPRPPRLRPKRAGRSPRF
jgi:micrococcal nuclease